MSKATELPDAIACAECGVEFKPKRPQQRYCTGPKDGPGNCQKKAERKRAKARGYKRPRFPMICHGCNAEFLGERRKPRAGSHEHQYCTHNCYSKHRRFAFRKEFSSELNWRSCADCGNRFVSRNGRQSCEECRSLCQNPRFVAGSCQECGNQFVGKWHPTWPCRYCSDKCETKASRRNSRRNGSQGDLHRKRARKFGVAYEWVNRKKVFERDDYLCGICGDRTDPDSEPCSPQYPTLDHVLPMALGGGHTYGNVQCACFECNWKKGDSAPTEPQQMQLGLYLVSQKNRGTPLKLAA